MAWALNVDDILASWSAQPVPASTNPRLLSSVRQVQNLLNRTIKDIDLRLVQDPTLQYTLDYVASKVIQREWYEDPRGYTSRSEGDGPFSASWSRDNSDAGFYLKSGEIESLLPLADSSTFSIANMKPRARPNFNVRSGKDYKDNWPVGENAVYNWDEFEEIQRGTPL